jgi:hypothetical protein
MEEKNIFHENPVEVRSFDGTGTVNDKQANVIIDNFINFPSFSPTKLSPSFLISSYWHFHLKSC